jgi:hypothetical protein
MIKILILDYLVFSLSTGNNDSRDHYTVGAYRFQLLTTLPIFTKLGETVVPQEAIPTTYVLISSISTNNMADARTCKMEGVAVLNLGF